LLRGVIRSFYLFLQNPQCNIITGLAGQKLRFKPKQSLNWLYMKL